MKKFMPFILGAVLLVAAWFAFSKVHFMLTNEDTENAQLEANIAPVAPKVAGYVTRILVKENQPVQAGDTLVCIDDRDLRLRVQQAEINLRQAEANVQVVRNNAGTAGANVGVSDASLAVTNAGVETANAAVATAQANIESAQIRVRKAQTEFKRYENLLREKSVTQQQFDNTKAEKESAEAALAITQKQLEGAQAQAAAARKQTGIGASQQGVAKSQLSAAKEQIILAQTQVDQRRAELDLAKLQLSYSVITAPQNGVVSKKNVQIGQYVNIGQALMSVVDTDNLWVVANFKETQLEHMKVGQSVHVKVDAYKDKSFSGKIESFAGATGARFSLLPPDNSTGNFVKVVQRVPVRIVLDQPSEPGLLLRPGMSVEVVAPVE